MCLNKIWRSKDFEQYRSAIYEVFVFWTDLHKLVVLYEFGGLRFGVSGLNGLLIWWIPLHSGLSFLIFLYGLLACWSGEYPELLTWHLLALKNAWSDLNTIVCSVLWVWLHWWSALPNKKTGSLACYSFTNSLCLKSFATNNTTWSPQ